MLLLDTLIARQKSLGLSDPKFASKLGVSYELWRSVRYSRRPIGTFALRGILTAFPELNHDVLDYLRTYGTTVTKSDTLADIDHEPVASSQSV